MLKSKLLWFVSFVHREGNKATHFLARFGLSLSEDLVWMEDVPSVISQIVLDHISYD